MKRQLLDLMRVLWRPIEFALRLSRTVGCLVKPDGVTDDVRWESVAFECAQPPILAIWASLLGNAHGRISAKQVNF